jgi:phage-related protein
VVTVAKVDGSIIIDTKVETDGFSKGASNIKSQFKSVAASAAKISATIVAAFSAAAIGITKEIVEAYAEYEQLVGGVETLFKGAAEKVVKNAENAFYTVGLSANEYMSTVTSFSASLISSLSGDTARAADVADMALTDMADNANKMGTSLEAVQTAYQGFAKQQYQLLDNLKLGYGGTKTEMERLLKDAEKLTGQKYDINNLADVYNAIHAIQVEMGIAGATAAEAEKTISGSANMVKAAWKNALTAMGGGGDLNAAINNLVFSISKLSDNVMPVVERALQGIGTLLEKAAPLLVETVAAAIIKAIPSLLNAVYQMIIGLANGIYRGIVSLFSGTTSVIEKQLQDTAGIAANNEAAADAAADLAEETENAGKAAKKSLAGFDELNILSNKETDESGEDVSLSSAESVAAEVAAIDSAMSPVNAVADRIKKKFEEMISPLKNINFSKLKTSLKNLGAAIAPIGVKIAEAFEWAWYNILSPGIVWTTEKGLPAFLDVLSAAFGALNTAIEPVKSSTDKLLESVKPAFEWIGDYVLLGLEKWKNLFGELALLFQEKAPEIQRIFENLGKMMSGIWETAEPVLSGFRNAWSSTADFVIDAATSLASGVIDALVGITEFFANVFTGDWKGALNVLIGFTNWMIQGMLKGINAVVDAINNLSFTVPDWVPGIGGQGFGFRIPHATIPEIPYLAKGAVIPPNAPFMAMLGDQRHGTNIEAPLSTIQDAVRAELGATEDAIIAAAEAVIERQERILAAIEGIEIGDTTIGQASQRYNRRMAIITGGV